MVNNTYVVYCHISHMLGQSFLLFITVYNDVQIYFIKSNCSYKLQKEKKKNGDV